MRTDVEHLPGVQQNELRRVQDMLMEEFGEAVSRSTSTSRKNGKIYKIILFGSYARDDWVDKPENGYQSDFDLLVVVSHRDLTDIEHYWYVAEDKILRDAEIGRPVNIIVHSLDEVNQALGRGEYFWVDIARDGIALYELPCHPLATPMPLTPADAYEMAHSYFEDWLSKLDRSIRTVELQLGEGGENPGWRKEAAFMLHQATERAYICFLLVRTLYFPRSHNVKFLRSLSEDKEPRLISAWPRETRVERRRFELLKRAYVEARYSASYEISAEDLTAIASSVRSLRNAVQVVSHERLDELRRDAGA
ncbi:MAG: HEPN domain-containing protein [Sphingomonas sp.]|jgi:predicted nucleotidyltransferase|uniref:HEPN domain-containing protein n=1 Tax=Sphingomonas sp. TaxID=28214 RepID=UPI0035669161